MNVKDEIEFMHFEVQVRMLLDAWGKGDDHTIQFTIQELRRCQEERAERLRNERKDGG